MKPRSLSHALSLAIIAGLRHANEPVVRRALERHLFEPGARARLARTGLDRHVVNALELGAELDDAFRALGPAGGRASVEDLLAELDQVYGESPVTPRQLEALQAVLRRGDPSELPADTRRPLLQLLRAAAGEPPGALPLREAPARALPREARA